MSGAEENDDTHTAGAGPGLSVETAQRPSSVPSIQELVQAIHASTELAASAAAEAAGAAERAAVVAEEAAATVADIRSRAKRTPPVERRSQSRPMQWVSQLTHLLDDARSARAQAQADHAAILQLRGELLSERDRWQVDSLTGVLARSAGEDRARIELDRARRLRTDLVCVFLDVSGLKATNDTHGHSAGDLALQGVATLLLESVRAYDTVFRYGGDEFVCVITEAGEDAMRRRFVEITEQPLRFGKGAVGLSFGITGLREGDDLSALLDRADADMYAQRRLSTRPERGTLPATA